MSSHHVVRDKQEPALIIANGESCSEKLLGDLLEWSPFIIVLDGAIHRVLELGIKIDVLLGDFDRNIDIPHIQQAQYPIEIIHAPDQNKTDLEKAFDFLLERGHSAANVVWATGRRADHHITNVTAIVKYRKRLKIVLLDDFSSIFTLENTFEKWYVAKTPLSLIPVGTVLGVETKGLKYNLHDEILCLGYRTGSSNEAEKDGFVQIKYQSGDLLLMECSDGMGTKYNK